MTIEYRSLRDKIMDKYWLDFIKDIKGDSSSWEGGIEAAFWYWFFRNKFGATKLEDYL